MSQRSWSSVKKKLNRIILVIILFLLAGTSMVLARTRSLWATAWDINTPQKIVNVVKTAAEHDFDVIFAEVRYRGDALYKPNKYIRTFPNPEPISYFVTLEDFDPLSFLIQTAKNFNIKVYAWMTTFVITPKYTYKLPEDHAYFKHPDWICKTHNGEQMDCNGGEGIFFDPGIPEVQRYTQDIILDVVANYDIDGVILDYIRYPGNDYTYNPLALKHFINDVSTNQYSNNYTDWKQQVVSEFIKETGAKIKFLKPYVDFAVTAFADLQEAKYNKYQDWKEWLGFQDLDYVHLMMYTKSDYSFKDLLDKYLSDVSGNKVALSIRAWDEQKRYTSQDIQSKIRIAQKYGFDNISIFHFGGIIANNYNLADTLTSK
ncbi:MAG TPA: hypothetical protein ENG70_04365 [Candidatus Cloacimonetes bacterium]|nr:hypothetical protein [Candidatus Cloacimonadota bacterium]HEX38077.1 hypothetical protein [Candidatus Cloacimonadota bacterium]